MLRFLLEGKGEKVLGRVLPSCNSLLIISGVCSHIPAPSVLPISFVTDIPVAELVAGRW